MQFRPAVPAELFGLSWLPQHVWLRRGVHAVLAGGSVAEFEQCTLTPTSFHCLAVESNSVVCQASYVSQALCKEQARCICVCVYCSQRRNGIAIRQAYHLCTVCVWSPWEPLQKTIKTATHSTTYTAAHQNFGGTSRICAQHDGCSIRTNTEPACMAAHTLNLKGTVTAASSPTQRPNNNSNDKTNANNCGQTTTRP